LGSLSEPRRKQNLYANPKRTAKFSNNINSDALHSEKVQTIFKNLLRRLFALRYSNQLENLKLITV
jgi:hypothetical protein